MNEADEEQPRTSGEEREMDRERESEIGAEDGISGPIGPNPRPSRREARILIGIGLKEGEERSFDDDELVVVQILHRETSLVAMSDFKLDRLLVHGRFCRYR